MCNYIYIYIYIHKYTHVHILYVYIYIYIYIYLYIHIYQTRVKTLELREFVGCVRCRRAMLSGLETITSNELRFELVNEHRPRAELESAKERTAGKCMLSLLFYCCFFCFPGAGCQPFVRMCPVRVAERKTKTH